MNTNIKHTALPSRLSREDENIGTSESILTQKTMLTQYAKSHHFKNIIHYVDDGYSGTNFERPDFQRLMQDIKLGKIGVVITKDLSRLGRDYIKIGNLLEEYFPKYQVRYIAINDDIDTINGIPEYVPFKNIINEWYARDISRKIRSAYQTKALNGEFTASYAPYGYKKDENNKHQLIVDEETSWVVKEIFKLIANKNSLYQVARILKDKKILKPRAQIMKKEGKYYNELWEKYPYDWSPQTIQRIITNEEYLGHLICNRNSTISYKSKKLKQNPREKWIIKKHTHQAIIEEELFYLANKALEGSIKKKVIKPRNMFSQLLRCDCCGKALSLYHGDRRVASFCCVTYRSFGKKYCTAHYTRYDTLYRYVLEDIRKHAKKAIKNKEELLQEIINHRTKTNEEEHKNKIKENQRIEKRLKEIKEIMIKLYEDKALNRIKEEMYEELLESYEKEKAEKELKRNENDIFINESKIKEKEVKKFLECINKYEDLKELNEEILHQLINKIVVYEREIIDGKRIQKIEIEYNFIND